MTSLKLIPVLALALLAGNGCTVLNSSPAVVTDAQSAHGIPRRAILIMYGSGDDLNSQLKNDSPILAPGLVYIYNETLSEMTLIIPQTMHTRLEIAVRLAQGYHYRIYYAPGLVPPGTTQPKGDGEQD